MMRTGVTMVQSTFGPRDRVVSALCALRHSSHRQLNLQRLVVPCSERAPRGEPPREMPLACAICRSLQGPVAGSFPALIQPPTVIVATPAISATSRLVRATMRGSSCSGTGVGGGVVGARATGADRLGGADGGHGRPHVGQPAMPVASVAECPVSAMQSVCTSREVVVGDAHYLDACLPERARGRAQYRRRCPRRAPASVPPTRPLAPKLVHRQIAPEIFWIAPACLYSLTTVAIDRSTRLDFSSLSCRPRFTCVKVNSDEASTGFFSLAKMTTTFLGVHW